MSARVLSQEFVATERLKVLIESIDGLRAIRDTRGINLVQAAALEALERLYHRAIRTKAAVITHQAMKRPVEIAQKAIEATGLHA